jgi:hypothetical protein
MEFMLSEALPIYSGPEFHLKSTHYGLVKASEAQISL